MIEYNEDTRWLAWAAYKLAHKKSSKACKIFRAMGPDEIPQKLGEFIKKWGEQIEQYKHASNRPGRGSKTHVDSGLVRLALDRFVQGYITEGQQVRYYPAFKLAVEFDPAIKAAVDASGVTAGTFFAHMRQVTTA
jgi:hypothetical protein